ncbi:MAG: hypothetical protein IM669_10475 [Phenylobacterium sp.]|nr:hypothetical protein [Phenylobacterium sp.]
MSKARLDPVMAVKLRCPSLLTLFIGRVISTHQALTIEGWDEQIGPSRYTSAELVRLRDELAGPKGFQQIIAALVSLAFLDIPAEASAYWVVKQTREMTGERISLGAAIVAAMVLGYRPDREAFGPGCTFLPRWPK